MSEVFSNNQNRKLSQRPARFWIIISVVLIVIAVVVIAVISLGKSTNTSYQYSSLVNSNLQGSRTSMEFLRPSEFTLSTANSSALKSTYLHKGRNNQGNPAVLGNIAAYAPHYIIASNPTVDLSAVRNSFNTASNYQNYAKQVYITNFLSDEMAASYFSGASSSGVSIDLGQPKSITTSNLTSDTWQFPFTAQDSGSANQKVQGEVIFHLGKDTPVYNGYDYLMLSTVDYNWQPNQSIWQQIVNSLKITEQ